MLIRSSRLLTAILLALALSPTSFAETVRVMSFNIRYGTAPDGENAWPLRRALLMKVIADEAPDLLGVQEALREQLDEIVAELPQYAMVGVGRNADGGGEYSAILYRKSRFDVCDAETFWLSGTPREPGSTTWGNRLPRICTWARLLDRTTGRRLVFFNTHWDHESQPARVEGGKLLGQRVGGVVAADEPAIVTGDFNAAPRNPAFRALLDGGQVRDAFTTLHPEEQEVGTFNGFGRAMGADKIDGVLASEHWRVEDAAIVRTRDGERYPSDHFPVTARLSLADEGDEN